jgi:Na+/H+-dicarboxylate symporter
MYKRIPLSIKILLGMALGLSWGLVSKWQNFDSTITLHYIKPLGDIFTSLLKMIAIPLVISSLIAGIGGLKDVSNISSMSKKTIGLYLFTTIVAIIIGLTFANIMKPGEGIATHSKQLLLNSFSDEMEITKAQAHEAIDGGPLNTIVTMFPENIMKSFSENGSMIQVVLFILFFGICMIQVDAIYSKQVLNFFEGINVVILKMIDNIMLYAPFGIFGIVAGVTVKLPDFDIFFALLQYSLCVVIGLFTIIIVVYPLLIYYFTKKNIFEFYKIIRPVQLLAFSTSSSSATLPLTMEVCSEKLHIKKEVTSFVLPLGSTVNMDGTSLYQAVATIFIAQVFGIEMGVMAQLSIVFLALISSIGAAGVPGAGIILLAVVLEANHIPVEGIALILSVDRILDMFRTTINVTGDTVVAYIVDYQINK